MAIERGASQDIQDVVMAMAHRGRLNVLANIMRKSPQRIFREFADLDPELHVGRGDVKYHLGHSTDYVAENGRKVHLTLCFNPSHLGICESSRDWTNACPPGSIEAIVLVSTEW